MHADQYIPLNVVSRLKRSAWKAWAMGLTLVCAWLVLILVPPAAKSVGVTSISAPLYHFFSFLCHQIPERSFYLAGEPFGVCSRCFGVYFGLALGFAIYPLWRPIAETEPLPKFWLFLSLIPITVDWSLTIFHLWENTHLSRFLTGTLLGVACATYIVPAAVEIARNMTYRRANFR